MPSPHPRRWLAVSLLLTVILFSQTTLGQEADAAAVPGADSTPALVSLGVSSGFPGFNRYAVNAAVQYRFFGLNIKAAPTPAGFYFGGGLRGYLPLGGLVPIYVGAGAGAYGEATELHLALGAHVPVSERFRVDLELGAAHTSFADVNSWLPWVSVGVSYSFPVETGASAAASQRAAQRGAAVDPALCTFEPDSDTLVAAFERTFSSFLRNAQATYGGSYTDLQYDYRIESVTMSGTSGSVVMSYSGSVRQILGGERIFASGTASADFEWNGCRWNRTALNY